MALLLGIDTGGTYTDAVVFDDARGAVVASAKSLTTKDQLSLCVSRACAGALEQISEEARGRIALVSLSTTLATNAIVEHHGFPVALVMIGQQEKMLERGGLAQALGSDPVLFIQGGHRHDGSEQAPLDLEGLRAGLAKLKGRVAAFAVCGYFAVRNPAHEQQVRDLLREETGLPVSCGHELAGALDAPRRALTALLNARLVPLIAQLIRAVQGMLAERGIEAPLMVVKGDGSLIAAETALEKPVETILSGPAASVVGARFLSGEEDIVVSDIGGTTTDIAVLTKGQPLLDPDGARVGGYRTMVEAVAVHTLGLGGDSEVRLVQGDGLVAGPRRVQPLSLLAKEHPWTLEVLRRQLERTWPGEKDGRFALRLRQLPEGGEEALSRLERAIWEALEDGPEPLTDLLGGAYAERSLRQLLDKGLVILSAFTPSDAAHLLGRQDIWEREAAVLGAALWARSENAFGKQLAESPEAFAEQVIECVVRQSGEAIAEAVMLEEARAGAEPLAPAARSLLRRALSRGGMPLLDIHLKLKRPLVGIGAPAGIYYPEIASRLGTRHLVPRFAEVCNAVGAVAGGVTQRAQIQITSPEDGLFRLHAPGGLEDFRKLPEAYARAERLASDLARELARQAGAGEIKVEFSRDEKTAPLPGGRDLFLEATVTACAYGRPRLVRSAA
ncbi:hydantoinase/oxoprolinase N-terminal domain-containing protein [Limibacillus halophilus]